ncbi:hypothetical protein [Clostridium sp.]|uniref:hypothetical protein n=1 Tax=Clostridium sp. TaxID=1506 RepID=UPI0032173CAB
MYKSILKSLLKCIIWGILWSIIFIIVGIFITKSKPYSRKDVLFTEGLIVLICAALATSPTKPLKLSLQGCGQSNTRYVFNAYLEDPKIESITEGPEYTNTIKTGFKYGLNKPSLIIGALICIIISYII